MVSLSIPMKLQKLQVGIRQAVLQTKTHADGTDLDELTGFFSSVTSLLTEPQKQEWT